MPDDEYFIEWVHRTVAATTGVFILATTIGAWINKDAGRKIKFTRFYRRAFFFIVHYLHLLDSKIITVSNKNTIVTEI